jgi:hypothetical protein
MGEQQNTQAWMRILTARAQGREVDPADIEAARAAAKPGSVGWVARVAAEAAPKRQAPPDGPDRFRAAVLARLGRDVEDDGPDAA